MRGDLEEFGGLWYLLARRRGSAFYPSRGVQRQGGGIKGKLKGFRLLPQCRVKEGLGFQMFDSCWPKGLAGFYTPSPSAKHQQPRGDWPKKRSSPSQPQAEPPPSILRRRKRCPPAQEHFCKSLSSRHPQPSTHPAVICDSGWVRRQTCTPKEDRFLLIDLLKSRPGNPGSGLDSSCSCPGRARKEPARSQDAGRGLTQIPAPEA